MTPQNHSQEPKKGDAPKVLEFEASPNQVERGSAITLKWKLGGGAAEKVLLDGQQMQGTSCTRKPAEDPTVYTLVALNAAGSDTHEVAVGVHEIGDVVSGGFLALSVDDEAAPSTVKPRRRLQLVLEGAAGRHYILEAAGEKFEGEIGKDGVIDREVPQNNEQVVLRLIGGGGDQVYHLDFGELAPIGTAAGVQARLNALGYIAGSSGAFDDATAAAIREFQEQVGLEPSSRMDSATSQKLDAAYQAR